MRMICRLRGHDWRLARIHIGQLIGAQQVDTRLTWRCSRCRTERWESVLDCGIRVDVYPLVKERGP